MQIFQIDWKGTGLFSPQQLRLNEQGEDVRPFVHVPFEMGAFGQQIALKGSKFSQDTREVLSNTIRSQYAHLGIDEAVEANIEALKDERTFTVTTGHQLSLLTGPLYFVVKILHVIKLTEELKKLHPEYAFVPVYWMATEDHNYEEIQSVKLFNRAFEVDYQQRGPVGRFHLEALDAFKQEVLELFGEDRRTEVEALLKVYDGENLAQATRGLVNKLFKSYGLVIVDGDHANLKRLFAPTVKKELTDQFTFQAVSETNAELEKAGFKKQVHARDINLFYIEDGIRQRIELSDGKYVMEGVGSYSSEEMLDLLENHPERFSPNALLRSVYQETILPNLAYIGGGGEMAYWVQLKGVFESAGIQYPLIKVRNSVLWIDKLSVKKSHKIGLDWKSIFKPIDELKKEYLSENAADDIDFTPLESALGEVESAFEQLMGDPSLKQYREVELKRLHKQMDGVKAKLTKMAKGKHDQAMQVIDSVKERLFPGRGLQERSVNFLHFCADGKVEQRLTELYSALNPTDNQMIVLVEEPHE